MSDTPRTDKLATTIAEYAGYDEVVTADLSRDLERELAEARKDTARLDWLEEEHYGVLVDCMGIRVGNSWHRSTYREAIDEAMEESE